MGLIIYVVFLVQIQSVVGLKKCKVVRIIAGCYRKLHKSLRDIIGGYCLFKPYAESLFDVYLTLVNGILYRVACYIGCGHVDDSPGAGRCQNTECVVVEILHGNIGKRII